MNFNVKVRHFSGKLIQTNSGAREHLFYEAPFGSRKTISVPDIERLQWSTFTCVLGPTVKGVFPPGRTLVTYEPRTHSIAKSSAVSRIIQQIGRRNRSWLLFESLLEPRFFSVPRT